MSKLHLVFGGRVKDPRGLDFVDLERRSISSASTTVMPRRRTPGAARRRAPSTTPR